MKRCITSVLEQGNVWEANFATEPFEAGWASEARWFIRILDPLPAEQLTLHLTPQISPDGILWCDDVESSPSLRLDLPVAPTELFTLPQRHFGNWLRLKVDLGDAGKPMKFLIYLVLKE
ncbi:hypothetical protein [Mesorhizobium sp. 1B3]|uniref:hypothetical protein n=1 Tax=Mesorhizobium sp. 1B3 TaxID=3243599 RepID=UPI003D965180